MDSRPRRWTAAEGGQVLVLTALTLLAIIAAVGLAVDAGLLFSARRKLQGVADAAATAGAQQIDVNVYRQSDGQVVQLDPGAAYSAAVARVQASPLVTSYTVRATTGRVDVTVRGPARLAFLPAVLPIARSVEVGASAWALPRYGIAGAGQ